MHHLANDIVGMTMMPRVSSSSSSSSGPRRRLAAVLAVAVVGTAGFGVAALVQQQHHRPSSSSSSSSSSTRRGRTTTSSLALLPPPAWSSSSSSRSRRGGGGGGGSRLRLGPVDDLSEYGRGKQTSELDTLVNKRDAIRKAKLANVKPDDDVPRLDDMSDEEIRLMLVTKEEEARGKEDDDALFAMPDFKTRRSASNADRRGLSSGTYGGDVVGPGDAAVPSSPGEEGDDGESSSSAGMFVDWTADYDDENEFHVPNRIGFTTCDWGNVRGGYVDGKLKKKDRAAGRYNKSDLKVSEKMK